FVIPPAAPADGVSTFHSLSDALAGSGLAAGDFIQIQHNSVPGAVSDPNLDAALSATGGELTIRGEPGFVASSLPAFTFSDAISIIESGFALKNVNAQLAGGNL